MSYPTLLNIRNSKLVFSCINQIFNCRYFTQHLVATIKLFFQCTDVASFFLSTFLFLATLERETKKRRES